MQSGKAGNKQKERSPGKNTPRHLMDTPFFSSSWLIRTDVLFLFFWFFFSLSISISLSSISSNTFLSFLHHPNVVFSSSFLLLVFFFLRFLLFFLYFLFRSALASPPPYLPTLPPCFTSSLFPFTLVSSSLASAHP